MSWYIKKPKNSWWTKEVADYTKNGQFDLSFGWLYKPKFSSPHINTDEAGNRITLNNPRDPQGTNWIYMFGGSALFGYDSSDEQTIPSLLSSALNTTGYPSYINNFGQFGFTSNMDVTYLQRILKNNVIPTTVIFYNGCNDVFVDSIYEKPQLSLNDAVFNNALQTYMRQEPIGPVNRSIVSMGSMKSVLSYMSTYIKIISYPIKAIRTYILHETDTTVTNQKHSYSEKDINDFSYRIANEYIHNATTIKALATQYGFSYLIFWQPLIFSKTLTKEEIGTLYENHDIIQTIYERAITLIKNANIAHFYDLSGIFADYSNQSLFTSSCHISSQGNEIVAKYIKNILLTE